MMLVSNFLFDLFYFFSIFDPKSGLLAMLARATAGLFLLLVGISLTLSKKISPSLFFKKNFFRGLKILSLGLLISVATYFAVGNNFIRFGILHLIGVSIILAYPFLKQKWLAVSCGMAIIISGIFLNTLRVDFPWLLWMGVQPNNFASVDYTPIAPWFGLVLIGTFLGNTLFPTPQSRWPGVTISQWPPLQGLAFCGRHSLLIYFIHQPILWAGFYLYLRL